jgi:hypothetical protein
MQTDPIINAHSYSLAWFILTCRGEKDTVSCKRYNSLIYEDLSTFKLKKCYLVWWPWMHDCKSQSPLVLCCKSTVPSCMMLASRHPCYPLTHPLDHTLFIPHTCAIYEWAKDDIDILELFFVRYSRQYTSDALFYAFHELNQCIHTVIRYPFRNVR